MQIAMWSGPRNLSTAMMYAFLNRGDTAAVDEPFYAAYLAATGLEHPMRDDILAAQPQDPEAVIEGLLRPPPGKAHLYQKHMAQHMLPEIPRDWLGEVANVFLIRAPERVIASFSAKYPAPRLEDIGLRQQAELYDLACAMGQDPVVVDAADIRAAPEAMLRTLCARLGLGFTPAMLSWPAGPRAEDGVWAPVWYGAVHRSTGFAPPETAPVRLTRAGRALARAARPFYDHLYAHRLRPEGVKKTELVVEPAGAAGVGEGRKGNMRS